MKRTLSLILVFVMVLGLLSGCVQPDGPTIPSTNPTQTPTNVPTTAPADDYSDIPEGYNQLVIYWD